MVFIVVGRQNDDVFHVIIHRITMYCNRINLLCPQPECYGTQQERDKCYSHIHYLYDSANIRTMSSFVICTRSAVNMMPITSRVLRMKVSNSSGVMP